jgi:hypothetical protein
MGQRLVEKAEKRLACMQKILLYLFASRWLAQQKMDKGTFSDVQMVLKRRHILHTSLVFCP